NGCVLTAQIRLACHWGYYAGRNSDDWKYLIATLFKIHRRFKRLRRVFRDDSLNHIMVKQCPNIFRKWRWLMISIPIIDPNNDEPTILISQRQRSPNELGYAIWSARIKPVFQFNDYCLAWSLDKRSDVFGTFVHSPRSLDPSLKSSWTRKSRV
ncbi:MAG: hypothetical protein QOE73_1263, partial [Verrucomicrobiota bacterium]